MKLKTKKILRIAGILIAVGIVVALIGLAAAGFNLTKLNTVTFVTNTYPVEKDFSSISLNITGCDIRLLPSEDGACQVVCVDEEKVSYTVTVENGVLTISRQDAQKWYNHIGIYFGTGTASVSVYLPQEELESLSVSLGSGDIYADSDLSFRSADILSSSSDVRFLAAVSGALSVETSSGDQYIGQIAPDQLTVRSTSGDIFVEEADIGTDLQVQTNSGNVHLTDISCQSASIVTTSGDIHLSDLSCESLSATVTSGDISCNGVMADQTITIQSTSGDVSLLQCDAAALEIQTASGQVSGTLLSEKIFLTDTTSGTVHVPQSAYGGTCKITTTSGDIYFEFE